MLLKNFKPRPLQEWFRSTTHNKQWAAHNTSAQILQEEPADTKPILWLVVCIRNVIICELYRSQRFVCSVRGSPWGPAEVQVALVAKTLLWTMSQTWAQSECCHGMTSSASQQNCVLSGSAFWRLGNSLNILSLWSEGLANRFSVAQLSS